MMFSIVTPDTTVGDERWEKTIVPGCCSAAAPNAGDCLQANVHNLTGRLEARSRSAEWPSFELRLKEVYRAPRGASGLHRCDHLRCCVLPSAYCLTSRRGQLHLHFLRWPRGHSQLNRSVHALNHGEWSFMHRRHLFQCLVCTLLNRIHFYPPS